MNCSLFSQQSFNLCYPISRCLHLVFISLSDSFLLSFPSSLKTFLPSQLSPLSARQTDADSWSSTSSRGRWLNSPTGAFQKPNETTSRNNFFISWGVLKCPLLLSFLLNWTCKSDGTLVVQRRRVHLSRTVIMLRPCLCGAAVPSVPWFSGYIWD